MKTFEVTAPGLRRGGRELAVGSTVQADVMDAGMAGKVREVEPVRALEVATPVVEQREPLRQPQRGRPKKHKQEESPD